MVGTSNMKTASLAATCVDADLCYGIGDPSQENCVTADKRHRLLLYIYSYNQLVNLKYIILTPSP